MTRRITFVLPSLHGGGAERAAVTLANVLVTRGNQVTLFLFAREGAYFEQVSDRVRVVIGKPGRVARIAALRRFLITEPQDVVVSFLSHFTVYVALRAAGTAAKYVISQQTPMSAFLTDHDYEWRKPWRRRLFTAVTRFVYSRVHAVAATSQGVADDLVRAFNVPRERIVIVHNPVDVDAVQTAAEEPLDESIAAGVVPVIVTAGRLAHAKNLPLLVDALELLARRVGFCAWVLGRGELESELRERLAASAIGDRVTLFGFQANPWKFMARADVFLLTSRYEGFGNVLIEAMAVGTPVVATASYGTRDIVRDEQTGVLVERHDAASVAAALERVLLDSAFRQRLAAAARRESVMFSVPRVADRFETLLDSLLAA